jgi:hypothetical protein
MNLDQGGGTGFIGEEKGAAIGKQDIIAKPNIGSDKPNLVRTNQTMRARA